MKRLLNSIGSRRFAVFLLALTSSVILLSNLLPKPFLMNTQEAERLKRERPIIHALSIKAGVQGLTRSPYFRAIPVFIFLSITVCTFRRLKAELKRGNRKEFVTEELPVRHSISLEPEGLKEEEIALMLKKKGWRVIAKAHESRPHPHLNPLTEGEKIRGVPSPLWGEGQGEGMSPEQRTVIYGTKGENGIWGSLFFHAGMNVALIGILISITTGMDGKLKLTEGFPVTTPEEVRGMKGVQDFPFKEMALDVFVPVFEGGFPVRYDSSLIGMRRDGRFSKYTISVNRLLDLDGYKFIFTAAGYSPRFRLKKGGEEVADVVANLLISMPGEVDYFDIPEERIRIRGEMFPDHYVEEGVHKTRGKFPFNPALFVEIMKEGKTIGRGFLTKGQVVEVEGYSLEFVELKNWVDLIISKDAGVPVIVAGFIIIAAGLCMRFILNDKRVWIIINKDGLQLDIGGHARFFPALFEDELKRLADEMRRGRYDKY